jgi:hypothetical protein
MKNEIIKLGLYEEKGHNFHRSLVNPILLPDQMWGKTSLVLDYISNKSLPIVFLSGSSAMTENRLDDGSSLYRGLTNWTVKLKPKLSEVGLIPIDGHFISLHRDNPQLASGLTVLNILLSKTFVVVVDNLDDLPGIGVFDELNIAKQLGIEAIYFINELPLKQIKQSGKIPEALQHNAFQLGVKKEQWIFGTKDLLQKLKSINFLNNQNHKQLIAPDILLLLSEAASFISESTKYPDIKLWLMTIMDYIEQENRKKTKSSNFTILTLPEIF